MRAVLALNGLRKLGKTSLWIRISFNDILNNDNQNTPNVLRLHVLSYFKVRMCEQLAISALTGKRVKGDNDSAIKKNIIYFAIIHLVLMIFSIFARNNYDFKVTIVESLLINRDHPPLNKNSYSLPLELFDD